MQRLTGNRIQHTLQPMQPIIAHNPKRLSTIMEAIRSTPRTDQTRLAKKEISKQEHRPEEQNPPGDPANLR
ncbi:hypothetical protein J2T58_000916 [Methanocalculus alkaliphilus]|nr:hypothetical protein [Methanocalculus alkaliphilus]